MDKSPDSEALNSSRIHMRVVTDPDQARLSQEIQVVEGELKDKYENHLAFLESIAGVKEGDVQRLKLQLDRLFNRNANKEIRLEMMRSHYEDVRKAQEGVMPPLRPHTSSTSLHSTLPQLHSLTSLSQEVASVEQLCLSLEAESECILNKLHSEKEATVRST